MAFSDEAIIIQRMIDELDNDNKIFPLVDIASCPYFPIYPAGYAIYVRAPTDEECCPALRPINNSKEPAYLGQSIAECEYPARERCKKHLTRISKTCLNPHHFGVKIFQYNRQPTLCLTAEIALIEHYYTIWNKCLEGLGGNGRGEDSKTSQNLWHEVYKGDESVKHNFPCKLSSDDIVTKIVNFWTNKGHIITVSHEAEIKSLLNVKEKPDLFKFYGGQDGKKKD